jgi:hypothetical protein
MSLYIDNELQGVQPFDIEAWATWSGVGRATNNIEVGKDAATNVGLSAPRFYFEGKTTGLRVYNRVLTDEERTTNYIATKGRFGK